MVIANSDVVDMQWIQDSLPVRAGGFWVHHVATSIHTLESSVFLASAAKTCERQSELLLKCHHAPDPRAIMLCTSAHNILLSDDTSAIKQHAWVASVIAASL